MKYLLLNTTGYLDQSQALDAIAQTEAETGLPCTDAVRFDAGKLLDAVMQGLNHHLSHHICVLVG